MPTLFQAPASAEASAGKPAKTTKKPMKSAEVRSVMTPLTCFAVSPKGIRFETQQDDEQVILFLRQHIIVNVPWVLVAIFLLIVPTLLFPMVLGNLKLPFMIPAGYIVIGTLFWYLITFGFILTSFLNWFFNIYIVTNQRVVDIDFVHLLYKEFSEARLDKIQDISYKSGGVFAALFNFGDVIVQTAGESPNFDFLSVSRPETVVQTISKLIEKIKKEGRL
ncbi:MAG: PH domain-containing protein [Patescibacteria group bacterium]